MREFSYNTHLVCAKTITFTIEKNILRSVTFHSGCPGSLQGLSRLVEGLPLEQVILKLKGIRCAGKSTSCPDQLAVALEIVLMDMKQQILL